MAAASSPFPIHCHSQTQTQLHPMLSLFAALFFFTLSLFFFFLSLFKLTRKTDHHHHHHTITADLLDLPRSFSETLAKTHQPHQTNPTHKLLLEILPSDSPKWATLSAANTEGGDPDRVGSGLDVEAVWSGGHQTVNKKKRRRAKKKSCSSHLEEEENGGGKKNSGPGSGLGSRVKEELVCLYPFTSSSSATQRKIKQQYAELMKCNESKKLTISQVGDFANCLVEARNELQHKADVIQRKFTITKALLFKADRSSFDRLRQQICKLELEQKRLEEDASVYNWLQQQLKLSPAYKKMLVMSACMESKAKSTEQTESADVEFDEISFEEFLAQEKKDSFWQKNRISKS